eukprot:g8465.t1
MPGGTALKVRKKKKKSKTQPAGAGQAQEDDLLGGEGMGGGPGADEAAAVEEILWCEKAVQELGAAERVAEDLGGAAVPMEVDLGAPVSMEVDLNEDIFLEAGRPPAADAPAGNRFANITLPPHPSLAGTKCDRATADELKILKDMDTTLSGFDLTSMAPASGYARAEVQSLESIVKVLSKRLKDWTEGRKQGGFGHKTEVTEARERACEYDKLLARCRGRYRHYDD